MAEPMMPQYVPSGDACLAFLEAAVAGVDAEGRTRTMDVGAGLTAALAVDGADVLRVLLSQLLSARPTMRMTVELTAEQILDLMGLRAEKVSPLIIEGT